MSAVKGTENPADLGTKVLARKNIDLNLKLMNMYDAQKDLEESAEDSGQVSTLDAFDRRQGGTDLLEKIVKFLYGSGTDIE